MVTCCVTLGKFDDSPLGLRFPIRTLKQWEQIASGDFFRFNILQLRGLILALC